MNGDNIMSLEEFHIKHVKPDYQLVYNILFNAINRQKANLVYDQEDFIYFRGYEIGSLGRKRFFKILRNVDLPFANEYLSKKYNFDMSGEHWLIPYKFNNETRLQALQWKILHGIYPTGTLLTQMKLRNNNLCEFCNSIDTLEHFFYECTISRVVWNEVERKLETLINKYIHLSAKNVLVGLDMGDNLGKNTPKISNQLILIGKSAISKAKFHKNRNVKMVFEQELHTRNIIKTYP